MFDNKLGHPSLARFEDFKVKFAGVYRVPSEEWTGLAAVVASLKVAGLHVEMR